ncbi:MAG: hypothetical protein ACOH1V_02465 [Stenotrophomonas sp.]
MTAENEPTGLPTLDPPVPLQPAVVPGFDLEPARLALADVYVALSCINAGDDDFVDLSADALLRLREAITMIDAIPNAGLVGARALLLQQERINELESQVEGMEAVIDASPKTGSDADAWQGPDEIPDVQHENMEWFWVSVRRANGRIYHGPASYLNSMLLYDENGDADEPRDGNRYSYGAADGDDGSFRATGWHDAKEHSEYDSIYLPLLADGDELVAWRAVADYSQPQASSAEAKAEADAVEKCECGMKDCGPIYRRDSESIPLCRRCWFELFRSGSSTEAQP